MELVFICGLAVLVIVGAILFGWNVDVGDLHNTDEKLKNTFPDEEWFTGNNN